MEKQAINATHEEGTPLIAVTPAYPLYRTRWVILCGFCLLSCSNAMIWITFSPISTYSEEFFHVSAGWINMLSLVYLILYIPFISLSSWIIDQKSLRVGVLMGVAGNLVGAWVRVIPHFAFVFLGQCICAFAQTFILSAPVKIAANWFGPQERTTATSIGALCNQLGIAIGFFLSPALVHKPAEVPRVIFAHAIIASFVFVFICIFFRSSIPPSPPSPSAAEEKVEFFKGIKAIFREKHFLLLMTSYGIAIGVFYEICTLLNQLLQPYNYTQNDSGILGTVIVVVGLGGALLMGVLVDKTKQYKILCVCSVVGFMLSLVAFSFSLRENNFAILIVCSGAIGFFSTAFIPVCLEAGVESTYPIPEGLSAGMLMLVAQGLAIGITELTSCLSKKYSVHVASYAQVGMVGLSVLCILAYKCEKKRIQAELVLR